LKSSFASIVVVMSQLISCAAFAGTPNSSDIYRVVSKSAYAALGKQRADIAYPNEFVAQAITDFVSGVGSEDDKIIPLGDDVYFMSGCRLNSCTEKGAVIVDMRSERLLAAGLRHFHCSDNLPEGRLTLEEEQNKRVSCDSPGTFSAYLFRLSKAGSDPSEAAQLAQLRTWAERVGYHSEEIKVINVTGSAYATNQAKR